MILATGGTAMVKAAYNSGTPAIGVGPRNAPAWVCADADVEAAARTVVDLDRLGWALDIAGSAAPSGTSGSTSDG
jgi:hypothetical protein